MLLDQLKELGLDTARVGLELGGGQPYFCTPQGADIFAWAGVDGIHYCFVEGFGEMVFAVNPMNEPGRQVRPLARDFADFLRLILACGDACIPEQTGGLDREQFDAFLQDCPPTPKQRAVLDAIAQRLSLSPMEDPFAYIKEVQREFDPGRLTFRQEYWDAIPDEPEPPEWKVYFESGFWGHSGRDRAGTEIPIGKWFQWAGERWYIPAVYSCGKGLVIDFCIQVDTERIRAFMDKWGLTPQHQWGNFTPDQELRLQAENPLTARFRPRVLLNSRELRQSHGCAVTWNPCLTDGEFGELEGRWAVEHYGLDRACGWIIHRASFPWNSLRGSKIRTLNITLEQETTPVPGPHFHVSGPGDRVELIHPETGNVYTLTVEEYRREELSGSVGCLPGYELPRHCTAMKYTLQPELADSQYRISDCASGDSPRPDPQAGERPSGACAVGIIGGADGPVAVMAGGREPRTVYSSLHFEPAEDVEWQIIFYEKRREDITLTLI